MKEPKGGAIVTVQELSKAIHQLWTSTQGTTQTHSSTDTPCGSEEQWIRLLSSSFNRWHWNSTEALRPNCPLGFENLGIRGGLKMEDFGPFINMAFPCGSARKESTCNVGDLGSTPGLGRSPEKGTATLSSILAWRIPWTV